MVNVDGGNHQYCSIASSLHGVRIYIGDGKGDIFVNKMFIFSPNYC